MQKGLHIGAGLFASGMMYEGQVMGRLSVPGEMGGFLVVAQASKNATLNP